jgi:uncharacterized protein (TIGR02453 family)
MKKTLAFLKELKSNNNKEWFDKHKNAYLEAKEEFEGQVDLLIKEIRRFDKKISPDLKGKDCTFRIYKDVRFSKDKTPYKTNFGASISPGGKKSPEAGYYIHIEPGGNFLAGGVWMPEPAMLSAIRQEIDYNPQALLKILKSAPFKKYFKGFDEEDKLKTAPKGFEKDHPQLELLKNRHFIVSYQIAEKNVTEKNLVNTVASGFKAMYPLMQYLREATAGG